MLEAVAAEAIEDTVVLVDEHSSVNVVLGMQSHRIRQSFQC